MRANRNGSMFLTVLSSFLVLNCFVESLIETKYNVMWPQNGLRWLRCSEQLRDFIYCAGAMNVTSCIPLTRDWCQSMSINPNLMYIIKNETKETLKGNMVSTFEYYRDIPMFVDVGAEIELNFTLHLGWESMSIDLHDVVDDLCIHIKLRNTSDFTFNHRISGNYDAEEGYLGSYFHPIETPITLKIVCTPDYFAIYDDEILRYEYTYRKPVTGVKQIGVFFMGAAGDVHWVKYKAPL